MLSFSPLTDTFARKRSDFGCFMKPGLLNFEIENDVGNLEEKTEKTITIKLLIQKSNNKILFAYAEENFVDFLFSLLTIPLGGVVHLLRGNTSYGSVGNLYRSLSTLKLDRHIKSQDLKSMLLDPRVAALHLSKNHILSVSETEAKYYLCRKLYCRVYVEDRISYLTPNEAKCDSYKNCVQLSLKDQDPNFKGQYTRPSVFIVTDDMHVSPLSLFSVVSYLRREAIQLTDVEEQVISIAAEAQKILKASFESTSVFTNAGINILPNPIKQEQ